MPKYLIDDRDVNMGNEDSWTLVVDDALTTAHIDHWWSHRKGRYNFKSGSRQLTLAEFRDGDPRRYERVVAKLREVGFTGALPS